MKKFHIAIGIENLEKILPDYNKRLGTDPVVVIKDTYALYRTDTLNISLRVVDKDKIGLRHLGWEDPEAAGFTEDKDVTGLTWELFNQQDQIDEILEFWPEAGALNPYLT